MVKKALYTIGFMMMFSAAFQPSGPLYAEQFSGDDKDVPFSTARLASKITSAIGLDPNANWFDTFGAEDEKDVGKDLYMIIYSKTQDQPQKQANKSIAGKYGMPEADLVRILQGDYTKLVEEKPGMTQEEAMRKISEIQQLYKEEKDLLQLKADIKAAVEPNEIFANGDINDSGFDLINDLQIIENLLFLKSDPIDVGGTFNPFEDGGGEGGTVSTSQPSTGGSAGTGSAGSSAGGTGTTPGTGGTTGSADDGSPGTGGTGTSAGSTGTTPGAIGVGGTDGQVNPASCFAPDNLSDALRDFEEKKGTDPNFKDNSTGQTAFSGGAPGGTAGGLSGAGSGVTGGASPGTTSGSGAATGASSAQASETDDFLAPKADTALKAVAAPPGEWLKEKLCPGVFCLTVEIISAPVTSTYQNTDNCIACHAEKINDVLKKVINHTLIPAKAPGNLGESATCKKAMGTAFGSISMNFYAVAMPVLTPVNDDLVYGPNIEDDWYNYCNAVAFPFSCRKADAPPSSPEASTYVIPPSINDMTSKKEITNSTETTSMETLSRNIETAAVNMANERVTALRAYEITKKADNSVGFFNPLKVELNLMNYYFANIRDLLHSLHEKVDAIPGTQACTELRDKKECT